MITPLSRLQKKDAAIQHMRDAMPTTRHEAATLAAAATGFSIATLRRWLDEQHAAGELHIKSWKNGSRNFAWVPVFADGKGVDALPPGEDGRPVKVVRAIARVRVIETPEMEAARIRIEARKSADRAARNGCAWLQQFYGRRAPTASHQMLQC